MYENVELDLNGTDQISTDEILRLYENDTIVENDITVEKACNFKKLRNVILACPVLQTFNFEASQKLPTLVLYTAPIVNSLQT